MFKRAIAVISSVLFVLSVSASSLPVGTIDVSHGALLSGARAEAGATVFEGDTLQVSPAGAAALALRDGSRVVISSNSSTQLTRSGSHLAVEVNRGGIILNVAAKSDLEGLIGDASFRPSGSGPSTGWMVFSGPNRIVLYAEKGEWIAMTGRDGRSVVLHQGERLDGNVSATPDQEGTTVSQENKKKKHRKLAVIWIGTALAGTTTALALAFGMSECTTNGTGPGCGLPPVASPITP